MTTRTESPAATRLFPLRDVVVPFVVSRAIADALILVMSIARSSTTPRFAGFAKWDGSWYVQIAKLGYWYDWTPGHESPWPFFPLLPWIIRAGHWLGAPYDAFGVIVNHVAFLFALAGLYRIARRHVPRRGAALAVWTIALFPASFIFSMVYPSAIFLAASVWSFCFVEERRDVAAAIVTVLAVMVRPNGLVVAIALAFAVGWSLRRVVVVCGPAALAFLGWCLYNLDRTGDALTFYKAKDGWPEIDLVDFVLRDRKIVLPHFLLAVAAALVIVVMWRRLPRSWLVYTGLYLIPPLFTGMVGLGRYAGEVFPPFVAAGEILRRWPRAAVVALLVACVVVQAFCVYWVVYLDYLP